MKIIRSIKQMQKICLRFKNKKSIAVVPTMGFLHEGHLSLVKIAQKKAHVVIVTIFVNPSQFGPNEDLSRYPSDQKGDLEKLKKLKVDFVFIPKAAQIYPKDFQTAVEVLTVTKPLCGLKRPGHFKGVTTIVTKLFLITQPDFAIFGKKDFQQLITIKTMVKDLNIPVQVVAGPIVREHDGLAMSSRNSYLSTEERQKAREIYQGLRSIKKAVNKKNTDIKSLKKIFLSTLPQTHDIKIDYVEFLSASNLTALNKILKGQTLVAVAVFVGRTRLIDNIVI